MAEPIGEITAVKTVGVDARRVSIYVDGRRHVTLGRDLAQHLGIAPGAAWTADLEARVDDAKQFEQAFKRAQRSLKARPASSGRIRQKLKLLDYPPPVIDRVIERLTEMRWLDDRVLAKALVSEWQNQRPMGPRMIVARLQQRGFARELAQELSFDIDADAQVQQALRLAKKKLNSLRRFDAKTQKRRLWGMLARRGFDSQVVGDVMAQLPQLRDNEDFEDVY